MDLVTRKWICELVSIEETSTQVQVVFMDALEREGLLELLEARQDAVSADTFPFDAAVSEPQLPPILLAVWTTGRR
jgi:putative transposase